MASIIAHPGRRIRLPLQAMGRRLAARIGGDCPLCGARVAGARLCGGCRQDILASDNGRPRCVRCALRLPSTATVCSACLGAPRAYDRTIAAFDYLPPADALIAMLKTQLRLSMAPVLARLLADAIRREGGLADGVVLTPVPASRASLRLRGMNPAGEIARDLAAELGLPLWRQALLRRRETSRQITLGRRARQQLAAGVFQGAAQVQGRHVALVDDVMTTGSTVQAAAAALRRAGAVRVTVLVVARTP